jgi:hypothetical protein
MTTREAILKKFVLRPHPLRPHRPFLVLYALGKWYNNLSRVRRIEYGEIDTALTDLLRKFAAESEVVHADYPFCALARESGEFWVIDAPQGLKERKQGFYDRRAMLESNPPVTGGFSKVVLDELDTNPILVFEIARNMLEQGSKLDKCFEKNNHLKILQEVKLAPIAVNQRSEIGKEKLTIGAGFGDPETNREVEKAAIKIVTDEYERNGWSVKSVEHEKCGFDLACHRGEECSHVEVKGVSGLEAALIITENEVRQAQNDSNFVLCVVTSVLTKPKLNRYSGNEFFKCFSFQPIQYRAIFNPNWRTNDL